VINKKLKDKSKNNKTDNINYDEGWIRLNNTGKIIQIKAIKTFRN
jgi:hypothetical protein